MRKLVIFNIAIGLLCASALGCKKHPAPFRTPNRPYKVEKPANAGAESEAGEDGDTTQPAPKPEAELKAFPVRLDFRKLKPPYVERFTPNASVAIPNPEDIPAIELSEEERVACLTSPYFYQRVYLNMFFNGGNTGSVSEEQTIRVRRDGLQLIQDIQPKKGGSYSRRFQPGRPERMQPLTMSCRDGGAKIQSFSSPGYFQLADGSRVQAVRVTQSFVGQVVCTDGQSGEKAYEDARVTKIRIYTPDFGSSFDPCAAEALLLNHEQVLTREGKKLHLLHDEITGFKGR